MSVLDARDDAPVSYAEFTAKAQTIRSIARRDGEDVVGLLLKTGAFHACPGIGLTALASKIEAASDLLPLTDGVGR